jgi:hypothetical protein
MLFASSRVAAVTYMSENIMRPVKVKAAWIIILLH